MADASVRVARADDTPAVGAVQARAWREAYAGLLPPGLLDGLDPAALAAGWREAVVRPPTPRHRVLVALAGTRVVGFAAPGPAGDPDCDPRVDAELHALLVDPPAQRAGHGSRLLAAAVDSLRELGFTRALAWVNAAEQTPLAFLTGAGWGRDGAERTLDLRGDGGVLVAQVRLHTDLSPAPSPGGGA